MNLPATRRWRRRPERLCLKRKAKQAEGEKLLGGRSSESERAKEHSRAQSRTSCQHNCFCMRTGGGRSCAGAVCSEPEPDHVLATVSISGPPAIFYIYGLLTQQRLVLVYLINYIYKNINITRLITKYIFIINKFRVINVNTIH